MPLCLILSIVAFFGRFNAVLKRHDVSSEPLSNDFSLNLVSRMPNLNRGVVCHSVQ